MRQTLFYIPGELAGVPVFGFGWLLAAWAVLSLLVLIRLVRRQGFSADTRGYIVLLALVGAVIWLVLPRLCDDKGFPIHGFGVMLLLAVVAAVALASWRARRLGIDPELIFTLAFWAVVPGVLGARLFYFIQKWPQEFAPIYHNTGLPALLGAAMNIAQGGLVFYGALIGGVGGLAAYIYHKRMPPLATLDLLTPSVMLGLAVGRLGCFLNGCCYGGICELPWAMRFPAGSPPHVHQVQRGQTFLYGLKLTGDPHGPPVITDVQPGSAAEQQQLTQGQQITSINGYNARTTEQALWLLLNVVEPGGQISITTEGNNSAYRWAFAGPPERSEPVHPTQLYSSINALLLCLFLLACAPFRRRDGEVWTLMLTIYPITRFLLEIIRTDEAAMFGTGLTISQNVSLLALIVAAGFWVYLLRRPPGTEFSAPRETA